MISNIQFLSIVIGFVLPLLISLVTKDVTSNKFKALILLALTAVSGFLAALYTALTSGAAFDWKMAALTAVLTFIVGIGAHLGLWKPTSVAAFLQALGSRPTGSSGATLVVPVGGSGQAGPEVPAGDASASSSLDLPEASFAVPAIAPTAPPAGQAFPAPVAPAPSLPDEVIAAAQTISSFASSFPRTTS